jgi:hypothetical protein
VCRVNTAAREPLEPKCYSLYVTVFTENERRGLYCQGDNALLLSLIRYR